MLDLLMATPGVRFVQGHHIADWYTAQVPAASATAVRVRPVPVIVPSVPPASVISVESKLVPGSSLNVKVMVALYVCRQIEIYL